jgi:hypothetical protein
MRQLGENKYENNKRLYAQELVKVLRPQLKSKMTDFRPTTGRIFAKSKSRYSEHLLLCEFQPGTASSQTASDQEQLPNKH